jgi:hypothetical protein
MKLVQLFYTLREQYFPKLPTLPHMDSESTAYFTERLMGTKTFVEYGSGGSTILAARMNTSFIFSVESDEVWMRRVQRKFLRMKSTSQIDFIHADIGRVGPWGTPLENIDGELHYANTPWASITNDSSHMFVLIDGRYRVTCLLVGLLRCPAGTRLLFDDYYDRGSYQVVESILKPSLRVGRGAVFIKPNKVDEIAINSLIRSFKYDSD